MYKDEESGNYYLRARYYDPEIQRFTQEDTYSGTYGDPMSQNGYAFCGNNPINYIDPTGHWQESDKKYDSATQQKIIKATNDYYAAKTPEGREAAHDAANAARKAGDKNGNGSLGKTVNTYYNTQTGNKGYVTGSEWESTLTSATKLLTGLSGGSQVNMTGEKRDHSLGHVIMDVVGLVPGFGEPFDLINTISYLAEGDHKNAGLSAASMIPIAGTLKGLKYADEAASLIKVKRAGKVISSSNAAKQIVNAERTGTALIKSDPTHRAASYLTEKQLAAGKAFSLQGGDGVQRTLLQTPGGFNGKSGIYEYILEPNGMVSHQRFIENGIITGTPN